MGASGRSILRATVIFFIATGLRSAFSQDRLVLISPHWEGIKTEFTRVFSKEYQRETGRTVQLDWRDMGGASDDLRFVKSEFKQTPSGIGIDLFFGGGMDPFVDLKQSGLLEVYHPPPSLMTAIPSELDGLHLYDPEGEWYGVALSSFGILKNKRVIREMNLPEVRSWRDLTKPELRGWVGSGDPRNSGATHMVYEGILQAYGWDEGWKVILGIGRNVRQFDRAGSAAAKGCSLGNTAYALVVDFYGQTQIAEAGDEMMELEIPKRESVMTPDGIAILKGAPNRTVAEAFLSFVLSERGQSLWMAPKGHPDGAMKFDIERMSIRPELYEKFAKVTMVKTNPFRDLKPMRYNSPLGTLRWSALNALMGAVVMDRTPEQRLNARVPISEQELSTLARTEWKDPVRRVKWQLTWQRDE